jgi:zinc transport system permease protein
MMVLSVVCSALFTVGGLAVSYGPDLPAGATTVLLAGAGYLLVTVGRRLGRRRRTA